MDGVCYIAPVLILHCITWLQEKELFCPLIMTSMKRGFGKSAPSSCGKKLIPALCILLKSSSINQNELSIEIRSALVVPGVAKGGMDFLE